MATGPNLTGDLIKANLDTATHYGAAVTAIPSTDSVIYSEDGLKGRGISSRGSSIYLAQTPQTFQFDSDLQSPSKGSRKKPKLVFTDDASIACYSEKETGRSFWVPPPTSKSLRSKMSPSF
jgi:2-C-methyl-D-erythritol 4-phosphate cytidylyltransferase